MLFAGKEASLPLVDPRRLPIRDVGQTDLLGATKSVFRKPLRILFPISLGDALKARTDVTRQISNIKWLCALVGTLLDLVSRAEPARRVQ
jgi:hypothetical protein